MYSIKMYSNANKQALDVHLLRELLRMLLFENHCSMFESRDLYKSCKRQISINYENLEDGGLWIGKLDGFTHVGKSDFSNMSNILEGAEDLNIDS